MSKRIFLVLVVLAVIAVSPLEVSTFAKWRPISDAEKALTEVKESPGAPAVLLYRDVDTNDVTSVGRHYYRIKILTEEGKDYGDIEIPYLKGSGGTKIRGIEARTVQPDGTIIPFEGKVFEKLIIKASGVKVQAKVFSFPDVQVGSILEYQYRTSWSESSLRAAFWEIHSDLFTLEAHFAFKPWTRNVSISWSSQFIPGGKNPEEKGARISLSLENIAAFEEERFMPPESSLRSRVMFYYFSRRPKDADDFWKKQGKSRHEFAETFIGKRKGIKKAVAELVSPADSDEEKVRKIYARVQEIRNLTYERSRSEEERKRENIKENQHVDHVLERGYGYRIQINRLFVAMVRAAGLDADVVRISERDAWFFNKNRLDRRQLDGEVAVVKIGGEDHWYDPSTPYCPIGMLSWHRTGVAGIRLDKNGGEFVETPQPTVGDAVINRKAELRLDDSGTLEGTLTVTFHGMEAIRRRKDMLEADEGSAEDELKEEIEGWLPSNATIEIQEIVGWKSSEQPLQVTVDIKMPDYALSTGSRLLVPTGIFVANASNPFAHAKRVHPVYFRSPYRRTDDLTIELPEGMEVESLPALQRHQPRFARYKAKTSEEDGRLHVERELTVVGYFYRVNHYPELRKFFGDVRTSDEEQAVLRMTREGGDD